MMGGMNKGKTGDACTKKWFKNDAISFSHDFRDCKWKLKCFVIGSFSRLWKLVLCHSPTVWWLLEIFIIIFLGAPILLPKETTSFHKLQFYLREHSLKYFLPLSLLCGIYLIPKNCPQKHFLCLSQTANRILGNKHFSTYINGKSTYIYCYT